MRITIDTNEISTAPAVVPADHHDVREADWINGGASSDASGAYSADDNGGANTGGPPSWLLAAVGSTIAASEAGGNRSPLVLVSDSEHQFFADAGSGPIDLLDPSNG
jgi:hypothetical protein